MTQHLCAGPERPQQILIRRIRIRRGHRENAENLCQIQSAAQKCPFISRSRLIREVNIERSPIRVLSAPNAAVLFRARVSILNRNAKSLVLYIFLHDFH